MESLTRVPEADSRSRDSQLAKLRRPSTVGLIRRTRLFQILDETRHHRLVWIAAPAGSGKTSLVSTWLAVRRAPHLWYQVDAGDDDPAALFHFLRAAMPRGRGKKAVPLPRLTPDRVPGLDVFARRFFEAVFERISRDAVLVFDDCHTVRPTSSFCRALAGAINVVPAGRVVICLSREAPPPALARWTADSRYRFIGWDDLRLTTSEAREMATGTETPKRAEQLNRRVGGWPAGLRLLLGTARAGLPRDYKEGTPIEALFDYFATEIFDDKPARLRDFLIRTSLPPRLTPEMARALTGADDAARMLSSLHRNRLFIDRRPGPNDQQPIYEYHRLFREFLLARAATLLSREDLAAMAREAARRLERAGEVDDAASLLIEAHAWPELTELVCAHAPRLAIEGRFTTIREWTRVITAEHDGTPWILYWRGVSEALGDPFEGRKSLERAYRGFAAARDIVGRFLTLAAIFSSYFADLGGDDPLDRWIAEFDALLAENGGSIPSQVEPHVIGAASAIVFRRPDHPLLRKLAARSFELVRTVTTLDERLAVALFAGAYGVWIGDYTKLRTLGNEMASWIESETSWRWASCGVWLSTVLWQQAEHDQAFSVLERALQISREEGLPLWESLIHTHLAYTALSVGDADRAERAIKAGLATTKQRVQVVQLQLLTAGALLLRRRVKEAATIAAEILPRLTEFETSVACGTLHIQIGQLLMLDRQHAAARDVLHRALSQGVRMPSPILEFQALMALAWSHFDDGEHEKATGHLRRALSIGAQWSYMNCHPFWVPDVMSELCERALAAEIEPEYVRRLIAKRALKPRSPDSRNWPWPVEIRALGGFSLLLDGAAVEFHGKAQRRVLDLLKAVVALGGRDVSMDALQESLWPEADGDAAKGAFDVTLHRLRSLLGHEEALLVSAGRLNVNPSVCHLDVASLQREFSNIERLMDDRHLSPEPVALQHSADNLLRLYAGPLLAGEPEHEWLLAPRQRVARRFAEAVRALGSRLVGAGLHETASRLYRHAIDMDPLDEEPCRRLISLLIDNGNATEALRLYSEYESGLAAVAGATPSPDMLSLIARLSRAF